MQRLSAAAAHTRWCAPRQLGPRLHAVAARGRVRCCSTVETPPSTIPWLAEVQAWPPPAGSSASSNGNGSASSSRCLLPLSEAALRDPGQPQLDAILVLAGGLLPDGGLPEWVHRRLDTARGLHLLQSRRPPIVCVGGGTPHKPSVLGASGHVIHESTSCASYLMATGITGDAILKEIASHDTVGNAYFSLATHAIPAGWRRLAVVTSAFHMPRSAALFCDMARLAGQSLFGDPHWFSLAFLSASDEGVFKQDVYALRLAKEADALKHWRDVCDTQLDSLPQLHAWLFATHLCYAAQRQHEFGARTIADQRLLDSY